MLFLKDLKNTNVYVLCFPGQLGIILQNEVAASMKGDAFYATTVAVTQDSLAATSCTCKAGSHGLERGVCVHNLPLTWSRKRRLCAQSPSYSPAYFAAGG